MIATRKAGKMAPGNIPRAAAGIGDAAMKLFGILAIAVILALGSNAQAGTIDTDAGNQQFAMLAPGGAVGITPADMGISTAIRTRISVQSVPTAFGKPLNAHPAPLIVPLPPAAPEGFAMLAILGIVMVLRKARTVFSIGVRK